MSRPFELLFESFPIDREKVAQGQLKKAEHKKLAPLFFKYQAEADKTKLSSVLEHIKPQHTKPVNILDLVASIRYKEKNEELVLGTQKARLLLCLIEIGITQKFDTQIDTEFLNLSLGLANAVKLEVEIKALEQAEDPSHSLFAESLKQRSPYKESLLKSITIDDFKKLFECMERKNTQSA